MQPSRGLFIGVYLFLLAGLYLAIAVTFGMSAFGYGSSALVAGSVCLLQLLFMGAAGSLRHIGRMASWRLLLCGTVTATLLTAEVIGLEMTWHELTYLSPLDEDTSIKLLMLGGMAILGFLWRWYWRQDRLVVMRRLVIIPAVGAIVELPLAAWAYHIIMARPHGGGFIDLTGIGTALVMIFDALVLAWALGPLLVWLYYRGVRRRMRGVCPACGYDLRGLSERRCPECGRAFTYAEVHATAEELAITETGMAGLREDGGEG